jgi:hypothetical protein
MSDFGVMSRRSAVIGSADIGGRRFRQIISTRPSMTKNRRCLTGSDEFDGARTFLHWAATSIMEAIGCAGAGPGGSTTASGE